MDFEFSPEQKAFAESVARFARQKLASEALQRAHSTSHPWDTAQALAAQGLLGIMMPEEDGGSGGTLMDAVIAIQEVASVCPKSADLIQAGNFGPIRTFSEYATVGQKARFLPKLLRGEAVIALGMSEPEAGSAATELKTTAVEDGDHFVVNGTKVFSTNSMEAEVFLIYVRFGPGTEGIGSLLIERGTPGFQVGAPTTYMNGEKWCQLYFDGCRVPSENLLLGAGGFKKQIAGFNIERIGNASRSLAVGRHAFNIARNHCLERTQFGRPIAEFQGLNWAFAEVAVKMEAAQLLLYRAASTPEGQLPSAYDTTVAKFACNEAGFNAANLAVQAMGAAGFSDDSIVEYCFRKTRGWMIAGGSTEMLRNRIAEQVFERRFDQRPPR